VLTPHFAEQLAIYEKQDQSIRYYYPNLIASIDFKKEERRLDKIEFASEKPVRKAKVVATEKRPEPSGAQQALEGAEELYAARDYEKARQAYLRVVQEKSADDASRARGYYGLGRIAALQKDPELAEKLFQQTLESSPDAQTAAWAHLYLGRLSDLAGEKEQAAAHYQAVVANQGATAAARQAAETGLRDGFKKE
jgi:TolA-binding protein